MFKVSFYGNHFFPSGQNEPKRFEAERYTAWIPFETLNVGNHVSRPPRYQSPRKASYILLSARNSCFSSPTLNNVKKTQECVLDIWVTKIWILFDIQISIIFSGFSIFITSFFLFFIFALCRTIELFSKGWFILIYFNPQANG